MEPEARWYPIALADGLEPGTSAGTRLFGRELVVWRDRMGVSHVWEDRCPHRGMRLSFGFVRGDRIACLYHGWQFDAAGQCRLIPAHPALDVPASIRTNRYRAAERLGLVWVFFDTAASEDREAAGPAGGHEPPPGDNAATVPVRSLTIAATFDDVLAALEGGASPFAVNAAPDLQRAGSLVFLRGGTDCLVAALQPLSPHETCLHLALVGATADAKAARARISLWGEALRRDLEDAA